MPIMAFEYCDLAILMLLRLGDKFYLKAGIVLIVSVQIVGHNKKTAFCLIANMI
tara:strand:+ start:409 stop:570 length:162 start_codon:yes stop_codon:yes gene_type:complete